MADTFAVEVITKLVPALVHEMLTRDAGQSVEELTSDLLSEINWDVSWMENPSPVQQLKLDLCDMYRGMRKQMLEIADGVKEELHMEVFMELDKMKRDLAEMKTQLPRQASGAACADATTTGSAFLSPLPNFTMDWGISGGGSAALSSAGTASSSTSDAIPMPTAPATASMTTAEKKLAEHPLFQRVNRNISRIEAGEPLYTADDFASRFDQQTRDELDKVEPLTLAPGYTSSPLDNLNAYDSDSDNDSAEDARWNALFAAKFASQQ
jgi:hypothetical protein